MKENNRDKIKQYFNMFKEISEFIPYGFYNPNNQVTENVFISNDRIAMRMWNQNDKLSTNDKILFSKCKTQRTKFIISSLDLICTDQQPWDKNIEEFKDLLKLNEVQIVFYRTDYQVKDTILASMSKNSIFNDEIR